MDLVLASGSNARADMLTNAGVTFTICPADIDERVVEQNYLETGGAVEKLSALLAIEKAKEVAKTYPDYLVIGSDQILECNGQKFDKAFDKEDAKDKLRFLRGKTHKLISGVAIVQNDQVLWQAQQEALLTMHNFDDEFLERYCAAAGDALTKSVGAYQLESAGIHLFEKIEGDYFTILGMPLLKLLKYLRDKQGLSL